MTEKLCEKWLLNKFINPATNRKIKETGNIFKKYAKLCLKPTKKPIEKPTKKPIENQIKLYNRNQYFKIYNKLITTIQKKYRNNCFRVYKLNTNNTEFRIGNRIILTKQIGTSSLSGIIYKGYYRNLRINIELLINHEIAIKIIKKNQDSLREIKILQTLTSFVINDICPHFPITYGILTCNKDENSNYESENIINSLQEYRLNKKLIPNKITKFKTQLAIINELANGDFKQFIINHNKNNNINDKLILNACAQIIISLMFFHHLTNAHHNDSHYGNFLYHKIEPGGYFHYKINDIDYYIENIGYLWVIWDFDNIVFFNNSYTIKNKLGYNVSKIAPKKHIPILTIPIITDFTRFITSAIMNTTTIIEYSPINKWYPPNEIRGYVDPVIKKYSETINNFVKKLIPVITNHTYNTWNNYDLIKNLNNDLLKVLTDYNIITKIQPSLQILNNNPYVII